MINGFRFVKGLCSVCVWNISIFLSHNVGLCLASGVTVKMTLNCFKNGLARVLEGRGEVKEGPFVMRTQV